MIGRREVFTLISTILMKHDYLESSLWYREKIKDPYQIIAELFSVADLSSHRKTIKELIQAASTSGIWRRNNPGDLLHYIKLYESLINAAYLINKEIRKTGVIIGQIDILGPNLQAVWLSGSSGWDTFPRLLSFKEIVNPYLVFKRFFKYLPISQWKQELQYLLDYALIKPSLFEAGIEIDSLSTYINLTKLIEAAHLIYVRESNHIEAVEFL